MGIRSGGAGVGTTETEMQILNGASSGNQQAYEGFQRYCDEIMTLVILGQRASSDAAGGLSKGTAQAAVRQEIERCSGSQFDPVFARIMLEIIAEDASYGLREQ